MKSHLTTLRDVEQELNIRLGGRRQKEAPMAASWEFRGHQSIRAYLRRLGRHGQRGRSATGHHFATDPRQQRVIVKASYTTHHADKIAGVLRAHVKYLGRDAASLDGRAGRFYDATEEEIDAKQRVQEWQDDARHFRFIVSPEQGHDINNRAGGLTAYTRELMQRVEKDLGTKLQWIAVDHYNTDDLHTHLLVRGRRQDGTDLRIDRDYLQRGMRQAAQEIATAWLGERTEQQLKLAADKELKADRYTALDSLIEKHLDGERRLTLPVSATAQGRDRRRRVAARLQHLESLGLARRDRRGRWSVDAELKPRLNALAQRNDIIKNLYAALGPRSAFVASYRGEGELVGTVAGRGTHDELRDRRYLLVRDEKNRLHYVRVANAETMVALEQGSIVRVSGADPQRLRTDARIAEVARQNHGVYSVPAHRASLPNYVSPKDADAYLRLHEKRLATLARMAVASQVEGGWRIEDAAALSRGQLVRPRGGQGVVQIVSARSIESQVNAAVWTWLDRQIHRQSQGKPTVIAFDSALEKAAQARRQWMIGNGYAQSTGDGYKLRPGAAAKLQHREWTAFAQDHLAQFGKSVRALTPGGQTEGTYRGVIALHGGLFAVVSGARESVLAPVKNVPPLAYGTPVHAHASSRGSAVLSRLQDRIEQRERTREKQKELEAERD